MAAPYPAEIKQLAIDLYYKYRDPKTPFRSRVVAEIEAQTGYKITTRTINEWVREDITVVDEDQVVRELQEKNRVLESSNKALQRRADFVSRVTQSVAAHIPTLPAIVVPDKPQESDNPLTVSLFFTDWHYNEQVAPERFISYQANEYDMPTMPEYNLDIADARIDKVYDIGIQELLTHKEPKRIERVLLVHQGDLNNGDIHHASVTNCIGSMAAAMRLADVVARNILKVRKSLPWVEIDVIFIVGNHGRILTPNQVKGPNPKTLEENYDWLTGEVVKKLLADQPNITVENGNAPISIRNIYGTTCCYQHGDVIRGGGGIADLPIYNIAKYIMKRALQWRDIAQLDIEAFFIGHFHTGYEFMQGKRRFYITPSLIGATERGRNLGYSDTIAQRILWSSKHHPLGASYLLEIEQ